MAVFEPPPTWANVIIVNKDNPEESKFNPVWLKWFVDLVGVINASGGGGGSVAHNSTSGLQGGQSNQYYHLTAAQSALAILILVTGLRPPTPAGAAQTVTKLTGNSGAPSNGDGANGDFYLRSDGTAGGNTVIYHKEAGAWVALVTT